MSTASGPTCATSGAPSDSACKQAAHQLDVGARRAHHRGDRAPACAQLERRLDDDVVDRGRAGGGVEPLDCHGRPPAALDVPSVAIAGVGHVARCTTLLGCARAGERPRVPRSGARARRVEGQRSADRRSADTRAMQRLRRIKQMGFAWLVYPGAEHSRFGHALGAFHVAQRVVRRLELPAPWRATSRSRRCSTTSATVRSRTRGSTCSPATATSTGARASRARTRAHRALEALDPELARDAARVLGQALRAAVRAQARVVAARRRSPRLPAARRPLLRRRLRDLRPRLDHPRDPDRAIGGRAREDLVVDYRRGRYAVEQYLFARSYMYAQVYHHKTVRAAEYMFVITLERFAQLARDGPEPPGLAIAARWRAASRSGRRLPAAARHLADDGARRAGRSRARSGATRSGGAAGRSPAVQDLRPRRRPRRRRPGVAGRARGRDAAVRRDAAMLPPARHRAPGRLLAASDDELHVVGHPRHGTVTLVACSRTCRSATAVGDPAGVRPRARRRAAPAGRGCAWSLARDISHACRTRRRSPL